MSTQETADDQHAEFAYGCNSIEQDDGTLTLCPVRTFDEVGSERIGSLSMAMTEYDDYLRLQHRDDSGIVDEAWAKEAWLHAIEEVSERNSVEEMDAKQVAEEFGWL